ncbi:MAG: hypothetical protein OIN90_14725 [Candidatus Methanoperedens sp.]|nr:hypothetical protein [Candidatus Methanoperedens sp.]
MTNIYSELIDFKKPLSAQSQPAPACIDEGAAHVRKGAWELRKGGGIISMVNLTY